MKLRAIFLFLSLATLAIQVPTQAFSGWQWATKAVDLVKSNKTVAVAVAGFGAHTLARLYKAYQLSEDKTQMRIDALKQLKALHIAHATASDNKTEFLNKITDMPISDFSPEIAGANGNLLKLLADSKPNFTAIANAYTQLYKQINQELAPSLAVPSIVSEVISTPDLYLPFIF